jgi:hypothetical protein
MESDVPVRAGRGCCEDMELEEFLTGVEVEEIFAEGSWLSPGSGHSLKGGWDI